MAQSTPDVEFPPYTILSKGAQYDLRFYDIYTVIRMPYERRDEGRLLFSSSCMCLKHQVQLHAYPPNTGFLQADTEGAAAGYIGLGSYLDGQNVGGLKLRQSQPVVMRFMPAVRFAGLMSWRLWTLACQQQALSLLNAVSEYRRKAYPAMRVCSNI